MNLMYPPSLAPEQIDTISKTWRIFHDRPIFIEQTNPKAVDVIDGYGCASAILTPTEEINLNKIQAAYTIWINPYWRKQSSKYLLTYSDTKAVTFVEVHRAYNFLSIAETLSVSWQIQVENAEKEMGLFEKVKYKLKKWMKKRG